MSDTLMIIAADRVSEWISKGEVIDRYFNPGNRFAEVDLVLLSDDDPDPWTLKRMVGSARLVVHRFPPPARPFLRTGGWRPFLVDRIVAPVVAHAAERKPSIVRCYGAGIHSWAAARIREELAVPFVVSLHINPDEDVRTREAWRPRISQALGDGIVAESLRRANLVLPVYQAIEPYLDRLGVSHYRVAYNMLNGDSLRRKADYTRADGGQLISVGRQFAAKDPRPILRALADLPGVELTLVGDGALHEDLRDLAAALSISDRITFHRTLPNDELCRSLADHDMFVAHSDYWELSKSVLEALLTGLPVVLNRRKGAQVPELTAEICRVVEGTPEGYRKAIRDLLSDEAGRSELGRTAQDHAWRKWSPEATEEAFVRHYDSVLASVR